MNNATHSHSAAWARTVSRYLVGRKQIRGLRYRDIKQQLEKLNISTSENNLKQRFNQGTLGAQLFTASLIAMGEKSIDLEEIERLYREEVEQMDLQSRTNSDV
ncbi:MAG: DUF6471 domain-containing protein [Exilibacterium sp.]